MNNIIDLISDILGQFAGTIWISKNNSEKVETNKTKIVIIFITATIILLGTFVGEFFTIKLIIENSTNKSVIVISFVTFVILLLITYLCLQCIYNNLVTYSLIKQINKKY